MKKISILITSRASGNVNHSLVKLLESLKIGTNHPEALEVLVKYDADDDSFPAIRTSILMVQYPFQIKFAIGLRERGYIDIHKGYNQLLEMVDEGSEIIGAMADDFLVYGGWDDRVREAAAGAGDYFIIHQRPHPFLKRDENGVETFRKGFDRAHADRQDKYQGELTQTPFDMDSFNMFTEAEHLYIIDEAPLWSRALLEAVGFFPVSFTDAWTTALEYALWQEHKINITRFLQNVQITRTTCAVDQPGNVRWHTDRRWNFDYIKSTDFQEIIYDQARTVASVVGV